MVKVDILKKIGSVLVLPVVVIIVMLYHYHKMKRADDYYSKEYVLIEKKEFINDKVSSVFLPNGFKVNPYAIDVIMEKSGKRTLMADMDHNQRTIIDVIKVGTIITKQKDSDTVVLTNITAADTSVYYFRILDSNFR